MRFSDVILRGARPFWTGFFFDADAGGGAAGDRGGNGNELSPGDAGNPNSTAGEADNQAAGGVPEGAKTEGAGKTPSSLLSMDGKPKGDAEGAVVSGDKGQEDGKTGESVDVTRDSLTVPEGHEYNEELANSFFSIVNDKSLSPKDLAQKLLDLHASTQNRFFEAAKAADEAEWNEFVEQTQNWEKEARNDPEYGGVNFDANLAVILRGRDRISTPEASAILVDRGLGSHPEILRMFYRIGKIVGEDGAGSGAGAGAQTSKREDRMFGKSLEGLNFPSMD